MSTRTQTTKHCISDANKRIKCISKAAKMQKVKRAKADTLKEGKLEKKEGKNEKGN